MRNQSHFMQNTLGFAPIVAQKNRWCTSEARDLFITMVRSRLEEKFKMPVAIHDEEEAHRLLLKAIQIRGDTDEIVEEAVRYVTAMFSTRICMHNHLNSMRNNCIRLQPRGEPGRDNEQLQAPTLSNPGYQKFLEAQKKF